MKKLPHELSIEELKELLKQAPSTDSTQNTPSNISDILSFLAEYNISPGDDVVNKNLLYKLYKNYSDNPASAGEFSSHMAQIFTGYTNSKGQFYYINQDGFKIAKWLEKALLETKRNPGASPGIRKHFETFLERTGIERGTIWMEGYLIHHVYREYCKANFKKPLLNYANFINMLSLYFEGRRVTVNRSLWFKVDEKTTKLVTPEDQEIISESRKNPNKDTTRRQKKNKKKRFTLSSSGPKVKSSDT